MRPVGVLSKVNSHPFHDCCQPVELEGCSGVGEKRDLTGDFVLIELVEVPKESHGKLFGSVPVADGMRIPRI